VAGVSGSARHHACRSVLAFAGLAVVIARAGEGRLGRFDQAVIGMVQNGRRPGAVTAARAVSALAEPGFVLFPVAAATAAAGRRAGWRQACVPCLTVAGGAAVRRLLSRAVARPRPPAAVWLTEPEGFSMPSKHTSLAALTAGACVGSAAIGGLGRHGAALLAAASVGVSRVYLGVHWPTDVLAAWVFAEAWLQLAETIIPTPAVPGKADRA
jgi:membrane-associated phospholipid phosphatase